MEWLKKIFKNNSFFALSFPSLISIFTFIGNLSNSFQDGHLDNQEFRQLMTSASGIEMIILIGLMILWKKG